MRRKDVVMRTTIDLAKTDNQALSEVADFWNISRADAMRRSVAITRYLQKKFGKGGQIALPSVDDEAKSDILSLLV